MSSRFAQSLCQLQEQGISTILKIQSAIASEASPARKVSLIQALRAVSNEYNQMLKESFFSVDSPSYARLSAIKLQSIHLLCDEEEHDRLRDVPWERKAHDSSGGHKGGVLSSTYSQTLNG